MSLRRLTNSSPRPPPLLSRLSAACCCSSEPSPLRRRWMLPAPSVPVHSISLSNPSSSFRYSNDRDPFRGGSLTRFEETSDFGKTSFYLIRDDLLHPMVNGNKARKLDALVPLLQCHGATDLVTCGGCQSAHAAAVAVCCAERGMRAHLLLRGEQPEVPTGYNLVSLMYGNVNYIARSVYALREKMLLKHAKLIAGDERNVLWVDDILLKDSTEWILEESYKMTLDGGGDHLLKGVNETDSRRVVIVNEGAGSVVGLLGLIRLVKYLSQTHIFGTDQQIVLVLDAGTGTTAIGLALGIAYLGLPWKVTAVMLADTRERYQEREKCLISDFKRTYGLDYLEEDERIVQWVDRFHPRRFGKVLNGEIDSCQQIAQQTGVLLDPVYTLAAWEQAVLLAETEKHAKVVMLHTGGTLGLFGLAQRYAPHFRSAPSSTNH
ncbi:D-cysteine desulfhydrase 2, mitochondrial [Canna indica]|uniref:D-cysteine desulfhydrase 2, mitochondrial n=1 Tax=Canna indica TaxID=4628 RepID=A0AAQ3QRY4_9LILI|nr:D-cysteine desulfhydrase 2, mitochondrial [Canna indica]